MRLLHRDFVVDLDARQKALADVMLSTSRS
jgi:hypothetical protein